MKNLKIDNDGLVTFQDGCCTYTLDNLPVLSNPVMYEMITGDILDNSVIMDPSNGEFINISEAAYKIACEPESDLATRCTEIWNTINNMYSQDDIVKQY